MAFYDNVLVIYNWKYSQRNVNDIFTHNILICKLIEHGVTLNETSIKLINMM